MDRGDYIPLGDMRSRKVSQWSVPRLTRKGAPTFVTVALAALVGLLVGYSLSSYTSRTDYGSILPPPALNTPPAASILHPPPLAPPITTPVIDTHPDDSDYLDLDALRQMVARSKGYWARDYSLHLGWNNLRYTIETAMLHARLLNRTVILPTFLYARSCEFNITTCASFAPMVNHGDAVGSDEWRKLPMDEQMSWKLPISTMMNLTHARLKQPVITISEYMRLHNIPENLEWSNGHWDRTRYHENPPYWDHTGRKPTLHVIENWWYDPWEINRIDFIPDDLRLRGGWTPTGGDSSKDQVGSWRDEPKTDVYAALEAALPERPKVLSWDRALQVLQDRGLSWEVHTSGGMESVLHENGWEVLYTYEGALGMEYIKNVVTPIRQVAPRRILRGFVEDYGHIDADVLLLAGEVHYERKPASLRFTTVAGRDEFSRLVLHDVRAPQRVYDLAELLVERMGRIVSGRMWVAGHMRRGDFIRVHWAMEDTLESHLRRIQQRLADGRSVLRSLRQDELRAYDIPDVVLDRTFTDSPPPQDTDKFYLATDEREPKNMQYLVEHGAVLVSDLMTIADRRAFGWSIVLTDVLGMVEQAMLSRAHYFYAHALSSYAGGTINMRAAHGLDPRTARID